MRETIVFYKLKSEAEKAALNIIPGTLCQFRHTISELSFLFFVLKVSDERVEGLVFRPDQKKTNQQLHRFRLFGNLRGKYYVRFVPVERCLFNGKTL